MNEKKYEFGTNPVLFVAMASSAVWFFSLLLKMIFLGFEGADAYWLIASLAAFGVGYLLLSKSLTKLMVSFTHMGLVILGMFVSIPASSYSFFGFLLTILFLLMMLGLFSELYLKQREDFETALYIAAFSYLFCMILPIQWGKIPLQNLFYHNFRIYSADAFLFLIPLAIALFAAFRKVAKWQKLEAATVEKKSATQIFFLLGLLFIAYALFRPAIHMARIAGARGFFGGIFERIFHYSVSLVFVLGLVQLMEEKRGKIELAK
jgi:hypothetical protein